MAPKRFNILLIDDSAEAANLFELALREVAPRATLYWVATGEEGLEALEKRGRFLDILGFDIVILDLNMPPTSGFDILQQIRERNALTTKPVIVMSSSRGIPDVDRAYRLGANSYLVKPISLEGTYEIVACIVRYWLDLVALPSDSHTE
jgi:chemotaxis family two-component system response regulator Rcp1